MRKQDIKVNSDLTNFLLYNAISFTGIGAHHGNHTGNTISGRIIKAFDKAHKLDLIQPTIDGQFNLEEWDHTAEGISYVKEVLDHLYSTDRYRDKGVITDTFSLLERVLYLRDLALMKFPHHRNPVILSYRQRVTLPTIGVVSGQTEIIDPFFAWCLVTKRHLSYHKKSIDLHIDSGILSDVLHLQSTQQQLYEHKVARYNFILDEVIPIANSVKHIENGAIIGGS